jgi:hypothetical protein
MYLLVGCVKKFPLVVSSDNEKNVDYCFPIHVHLSWSSNT